MLKKKILTLVAATVLSLSALPALADSVSFGFTVGDHGNYRGGHHGWNHGGWHRGYYERSHFRPYYGPRFYGGPAFYESSFYDVPTYYSSQRVVYVEQPPVYIQDEQPIVASKGRVVSNNPYCREYQRSVNVGGHLQESYGTACRQPDGAWKVVSGD